MVVTFHDRFETLTILTVVRFRNQEKHGFKIFTCFDLKVKVSSFSSD